MDLSSLSGTVRRTSNVLRQGASSQVADYEQRFTSLKSLYDDLLSDLIVMNFSPREAYETAKQFFQASSIRFAAVDGTMYSRPLFDLIVFFGGAYASTGTVTFSEAEKPIVHYDERTISNAAGISSVVPVYVNEVPDIDQAFFEDEQHGANPNKPLTDQSIINNATIANWIMTFAEHYLAYKLAIDTSQNIRLILFDRSLSIERASLIYDTSKRETWQNRSSIIGYKIDDEPFDVNDLSIARQCIRNQNLGLPPPRADYLRHAIIQLIKEKGPLTENQILSELGIADEQRAKRARRYLKHSVEKDSVLTEKDGNYALVPKYVTIMERVRKLVTELGDRFFFNEKLEPDSSGVMKVLKDGKECWLTTVDVAFLTLFTLQLLMDECWKKHILLIGITKDTAARDFKRQLVPTMHNEGMLKKPIRSEEFEKLPNTDRMILQSSSIFHPESIVPPWSLIEYDSAFRTIVSDRKNRKGYVSGAIKNRISLEKTFLKTYVQLSQAKTDPVLRSNVLLIDRLAYPEFDYKPENTVKLWNEFGAAQEPIEILLYKNKDASNRLQNLVMNILTAMAPASIPEAFGHNKPLFIADKIAKWNYGQFKRVVDTTADWILNNHKLRKFIFYMSTFRERRATIEAARREQS